MSKYILIVFAFIIILTSCKDDDISLFDKTADERVAEAIGNLKSKLVEPSNGWKIKYKPERESGSYNVLMKFSDDNTLIINTDLGENEGEFFQDTLTYRIDSSLGLELIIESYSFFSFLFERDQATFLAEYEFLYVNETPDEALVFSSKTDPSDPTIIVFEKATAADADLLSTTLANKLSQLTDDFDKYSTSAKIAYSNKDLVFYIALDNLKRTISFTSASRISDTSVPALIDFTTGYVLTNDSISFNTGLAGKFFGYDISIKGLKLNDLISSTIDVCPTPIPINGINGFTSSSDPITLITSIVDLKGKSFLTLSDFFFSGLNFISNNGDLVVDEIMTDITGAVEMHMYNGLVLNDGSKLYAIGFVIQNQNGTTTFALRQYTPELIDNNIIFHFEDEISIFGEPNTDANIENVNIYLNALTQGDKTYVFQILDNVYEFYNPCTGWSFIFVNANQ
jgi:hypothetical protein